MYRRMCIVAIGLAGLLVRAHGQVHHAETQPNSQPPPAAQAGRKVFAQSCGFCHGEDAAGSRAPDLIRSPLVSHDKNGDLIGPMIRNGRPDKGMPGFPSSSLPDAQVGEIVSFLHERALEARESAHVSRDYPLEKLLTGNAEAGKVYFSGAGQCSSCHAVTGDLKGIAARYSPIDLQQALLYPGRHKAVRTATVSTHSGERVEGKLEHLDEFTVAVRDRDGWYHSWKRDNVDVTVHDPLEQHRKLLEKYTDEDVHNLFAYLETLK